MQFHQTSTTRMCAVRKSLMTALAAVTAAIVAVSVAPIGAVFAGAGGGCTVAVPEPSTMAIVAGGGGGGLFFSPPQAEERKRVGLGVACLRPRPSFFFFVCFFSSLLRS